MCSNITMAFDRLFCPIRSHKSSRKAAAHHQATSRQTELVQQSENGNNQHRNHHANSNTVSQFNSTTIPYRFVTEKFIATGDDELSVEPNDVVFYVASDVQLGQSWSYVRCLTKNCAGFVPSDILSTEPKQLTPRIKKKLPRSMADPSVDHDHDVTHPHKILSNSYKACQSNGDSVKLQQAHLRPEQAPHFDMPPNSLQGSSGCQTVQKYPDWSYNHPGYYNLQSITEPQYLNCRPFPRKDHGWYVVMHNFVAREEGDQNVRPGDCVIVLNKEDSDWYWVRRDDHQEGFVPARFICPYEQVQSVLDKGNSTVTMKSSNQVDFHTYINHGPDRESLPTEQSSIFQ